MAGPMSTHEVDGLTVADVMHADATSLPVTVTVGELRDWFSVSQSRRLAVIADDVRYAASLTPSDLAAGEPADLPAVDVARHRKVISPDMPAATGRDLVVAADGRRLPVVDADGRLRGVLAVTNDLQYFACPPSPSG
jgi:CBS domain-containing protein